jgi:transposase-like protein
LCAIGTSSREAPYDNAKDSLLLKLRRVRGVELEHAPLHRWVITDSPQLEDAFHRRTRPVWVSWRMDETSIQVKGAWR